MSGQGRSVHSVEKAIRLLDCFWEAGGSLALTELVQKTGWAKSTVHGLLSSMVETAVVEQDKSDGRYRLGYHLFELGSAVAAGWDVVGIARPRLEELAQSAGESAYLARLSGDELILVECVEPRSGFRVSSEPGTRIPLHCSSQGKCILAAMPEEQAREILSRKGMARLTPNTITTWEGLSSQLALTRELGYSMERGEYRAGLQSVGAPVYTSDGRCSYAIGVVGIQTAGQLGADKTAINAVKQAAERASYDLGWRPEKNHRG
ncbi:MAG: IclR family transcriptional regulator [Oscillospiraceae bacterium]|nr:IclR family transcriptional regulator [Oscillospiraceae bacterium]MBR2889914.1 IclR family transcriptional regulator [Oscillospiraceae bacterium]